MCLCVLLRYGNSSSLLWPCLHSLLLLLAPSFLVVQKFVVISAHSFLFATPTENHYLESIHAAAPCKGRLDAAHSCMYDCQLNAGAASCWPRMAICLVCMVCCVCMLLLAAFAPCNRFNIGSTYLDIAFVRFQS